LALGAGLRSAKNMVTSLVKDDTEVKEDKASMPVTNLPLRVSPEEAEELERQGIKVKKVLKKRAALRKTADLPESMAVGVGGLASALGGWYLTDQLITSYRKRQAKQRLEQTRKRIRGLLEENPDVGDQPLFNQMKTAEEKFFKKADLASFLADTVSGGIPSWFAGSLGIATGISALSAYHASNERNKLVSKLKAIKRMMRSRPVEPPVVGLDPIVELEEQPKTQEQAAEAAVNPAAGPVVSTSGSPSQQAVNPGSI